MSISQGRDTDDIGFADFHQKIRDHLIELIMAHFDAIGVLDRFHADFFIGIFGGGVQGRQWFFDEAGGGCLVDRHP